GTAWRALDEVDIEPALHALAHSLQALHDTLVPLRDAAPGFDACHPRAQEQLGRLRRWLGDRAVPASSFGTEADADRTVSSPAVHWYDLTPRGFRLQRRPLDVSVPLRAHRDASHAAWVFTPATLAVAGRFDHIAQRLG